MTPEQFDRITTSLGFKIADLAKMIGCDARSIRRYLDGSRAIPTSTALLMVALNKGTLNEHILAELHQTLEKMR
jgi:plasmid maintenance system antidote protein VapI